MKVLVIEVSERIFMDAKTKTHKMIVRKPFSCGHHTTGEMLYVPKDYVFTATARTYRVNGLEVQDFSIYPDGKLFKEKIQLRGIPCSYTKFFEDELTS